MSGLAVTPFALGSGVAAWVGGRVVASAGRTVVLVGLALVLVGLAVTDVVVGVVGEQPYVGWAIAAPLLVAGVGSGLVVAPNRTLTLADVPVQRGGVAAGVLQVGQRLGAALGVACVGAVLFQRAGPDRLLGRRRPVGVVDRHRVHRRRADPRPGRRSPPHGRGPGQRM